MAPNPASEEWRKGIAVDLTSGSTSEKRRIGIAADLDEESIYAVRWAASNYIHPEDTVILLHVQSSDELFGADWGDLNKDAGSRNIQQENEQDVLSMLASSKLVGPLHENNIIYKFHVVKDFDKKERICLEAERLNLTALIMGDHQRSARKRNGLESVSEYCMRHCECPVLVVGHDDDEKSNELLRQASTLCLDSKI